jgi:hypothetical protein
MFQLKRRDRIWIGMLGVLTTLAMFSAAESGVKLGLLGAYAAATLLITLGDDVINGLRQRVTPQVLSRDTRSAAAREAMARAHADNDPDLAGFTLADIGLFASETSEDGVTFRRTREVSNDDDGVRPYLDLMVDEFRAEKIALIRYEMADPSGETVFLREENAYLRLGKNTLHPDHHLPLGGAVVADQMGNWDMRVSINGIPLGTLMFTVTPSDSERLGRLSGARNSNQPTRFEDLLRNSPRDTSERREDRS